jgi:CheY-like chemotaxis protein
MLPGRNRAFVVLFGRRKGIIVSARVLIVDDDEDLLRMLSKVVEGEGLDFIEANDGESAINVLQSVNVDVLLVDKNLPGVSGLDVARFAREARPDIPIIMITGYSTEESRQEAERLDFTDYLEKPLDLFELRIAIQSALRTSRLGKVIFSEAGE